MPQTPERFYLTTPIYYVNARPHLGHTYTTILCDAIARRKRIELGDENVWFLTGTDEHGQKIERSAVQAGRSPAEFAAAVSAQFRGLWDRIGITYNDYIRTTETRHQRGVQKFFALLRDKGFIYKGTYTGQYCVSDELYVDAPAGSPCPDCGRPTETVSEENYYFKLSAFQDKLLAYYEAHPDFIEPEGRRNEVLAFVRSGLKDLSVSRTSFNWGIPVPDDSKHVVYVWLDALANYITALGWESEDPAERARFEKYWPADLHVIGKEISRFHCVYWPAFLMAAGLPLPKKIVAHGWLLFEQSKMSKSRGNIVRAETILEVLGADALRYFLLREVSFGNDGSFSFDALVQRYNADLANGYGNLVSRVVAMIGRYFGGVVPTGTAEPRIVAAAAAATADYTRQFDNLDFARALESLWGLVAVVDGYLTETAPWKIPAEMTEAEATERRADILYTAAEAIRIITALVVPVLPEAAARVWAELGLGDIQAAATGGTLKAITWGGLKPGTKLGEPGPLFPRADKEFIQRMQDMELENNANVIASVAGDTPEPAAAEAADAEAAALAPAPVDTLPHSAVEKQYINIDDFAKVELRVARILVAERIPKADKLLRLEVDMGYEQRQICAGIAQYYTPEQLIGRKIVIVANLAPRKMRGLISNGMLLAASLGEEGKPVLAGFLEEVEIGARLK
jgi:methionyl-tRNA synthetase